jgi:DNA-binding XRE family transcriptional regulator
MLAVVKTPLTSFEVKGDISKSLMDFLKAEYGKTLKIKPDPEDETEDYFASSIHKKIKQETTSGSNVRVYREIHELTQEQLGKKLGVSNSFICDLEKGRREISKEMAKKLGELFDTSVERFF